MTAKGISLWLAASMLLGQSAQALDVTVAYQTSAEPAKVAQADNSFARESGATVDWRKFDSGASVVRALASGDVQIGNIGSSPWRWRRARICPSRCSCSPPSSGSPRRWW